MTGTHGRLHSLRTVALILVFAGTAFSQRKDVALRPTIPRTWDEKALADWATPVAGLNVRPGHFSEEEYYNAPLHNYRTYPVYMPGREPAGYWEMLQSVGAKPIFDPKDLKSEADWIEAGRLVFEQADHITQRNHDPKVVASFRSPDRFAQVSALPDGTIPSSLRWVPTENGIAIGLSNCGSCHRRYGSDGTRIDGPPTDGTGLAAAGFRQPADHIAGAPFRLPEAKGSMRYRAFGVPWIKADIHERLKEMSDEEYGLLRGSTRLRDGVFARWNGSVYYPTKIPDLIGVKDRKYLDHTGTHQNRGIGDLMRYSALVSFADSSDFGPHHMLTSKQRKIEGRLPDESLYALALYMQSLQPPPNPNPFDENAVAGKKIFEREGCGGCHTPGIYTNNKLTLASGFHPPSDKPPTLDIMPLSVGTDPGLALKTRKGTGYYKVPSLKGVWYRGHYLHDGSLASLEEMFDPNRLNGTFSPRGWNPAGIKTRAVVGHEYGLKLTPAERKFLLSFLRTL